MDKQPCIIREREQQPYAFYTRYPEGISGDVAEDLKCPFCGAQEIIIIKEFESASLGMLGDLAQCWICKHEFRVTDKCWKSRQMDR